MTKKKKEPSWWERWFGGSDEDSEEEEDIVVAASGSLPEWLQKLSPEDRERLFRNINYRQNEPMEHSPHVGDAGIQKRDILFMLIITRSLQQQQLTSREYCSKCKIINVNVMQYCYNVIFICLAGTFYITVKLMHKISRI